MKVVYGKYSIDIIPQNDADEVYLETVLDMKEKGDVAVAERVNVVGFYTAFAYVKVRKTDK